MANAVQAHPENADLHFRYGKILLEIALNQGGDPALWFWRGGSFASS